MEDGPSTAGQIPAFLARFDWRAGVVVDADSALLERYNPAANLPFTAVVDGTGRVRYARSGYEPGDERALEAAIRAVLGAPAPEDAVAAQVQTRTMGLGRRDDFRNTGRGEATALIERLDASAAAGPSFVSLRVDGSWLEHPERRQRDLRPEKAAAGLALAPLRLTAGDSYARVGHGLLLSVRRVDPLGLDTTIRGGRVDLDSSRFGATAVAGLLNPQNTDPIELLMVDDARDIVAALELREKITEGLALGQGALAFRSPDGAPDGGAVEVGAASVWANLARGGVDAAIEAAGLVRRGATLGEASETGHGVFGRLGSRLGRASLLIEAKWYRRLALPATRPELAYNEPPSLERDDQEVPANADSAGARARVDLRAGEQTTLFANLLAYRFAEAGGDPFASGLAAHGYAGADRWFAGGSSVAASAGARRETDPDGEVKREVLELNGDGAVPMGAWALSLKWDHRWEEKRLFSGPRRFVKGLATLSLGFRARATVGAVYGYSTEAAGRPTHFPGGELRIVFGGHGELRLFAGRQVGGRVCVSGSCRDVPPFEGVRLDLELRM
jgi:hypothetical protein